MARRRSRSRTRAGLIHGSFARRCVRPKRAEKCFATSASASARRASRGARADVSDHGVIWLNGVLVSADEAHVSVFDRGFQLGDAVFETLRARGGHVTELAEHLARLRASADGLEIDLP